MFIAEGWIRRVQEAFYKEVESLESGTWEAPALWWCAQDAAGVLHVVVDVCCADLDTWARTHPGVLQIPILRERESGIRVASAAEITLLFQQRLLDGHW